jgi:uncharacterized membrane protein
MTRILLFTCTGFAALFVLWLGGQLPATVATHFGIGGEADAHMPRDLFVALFALLVVTLPVLSWWLQAQAVSRGKAKIPHAAHWFSPAQRGRTEGFLHAHAAWFAIMVCVFFCYTFWLVVLANTAPGAPAPLPMSMFFRGVLVMLLFWAAWLWVLHARFRRPDVAHPTGSAGK